MRKKKSNKWLVTGLILILIVILIVLINVSKGPNTDTSLNLTEKRWIENNKKDVINISVANNIPIFSMEGEGVFFDFINKFEESTELSLNLIPYDASGDLEENDIYFEVVKHDKIDDLKDDDMVFYKDYYVLVSREDEKVTEPGEVRNKKIGLLSDDLADVSYYISSENGVTYTPYQNVSELENAIKNSEVDYIAVPKTRYEAFILENKYHVIYNITEMREAYVLRTSKDIDKSLVSIVNKKFLEYKNNDLQSTYDESLINLLMTQNNISEKSKADFLSKK